MSAQTSQSLPMFLYLVAGVAGAGGQYWYKLGASRMSQVPLWHNWAIAAGMCSFFLVMVAFVASFRLGGRLSVVYPMYATTFVWGALIGVFVEHERMTWMQGIGVGVIVVGCIFVAMGASK